jgi:Na+/H+ antiporter NhaD/arsenite permease-like protein
MEDWLRLDKSIIAVVMAAVLWTVRAYDIGETENKLLDDLVEQLGEMAEVVFFLLSAMSIVETIELHEGFFWVEQWLRRTNGSENITWRLPVALSGITFCLSAVLDNLTATIVMMKLLRALLPNSQVDRHICGSIVVVAANAGGAWSPVGDVTTTMLWIAGDISTSGIVAATIIPSLICWLVPLGGLTATWLMGSGPRRLGDSPTGRTKEASDADSPKYPRLLFAGGMLALLMVPILKTFAHIPPYMGMLFVMTTLWGCVEFLEVPSRTVADGMRRVDIPGVMYFVGMILSVGALMVLDVLRRVAASLEGAFPGVADPERLGPVICVTSLLGMISAVVDNVPLVRAIIEMFPDVERDASLWHLTALTAGTGGSILVIGSVAGVAFMNMEHVGFWWYVKRVSPWVLLGYGCGIAAYAVQRLLLRH